MKPITTVATFVFTLIAVVQLLRLVFAWQVTVNGIAIPMWASVIALLVTASLAIMLWRESRQSR